MNKTKIWERGAIYITDCLFILFVYRMCYFIRSSRKIMFNVKHGEQTIFFFSCSIFCSVIDVSNCRTFGHELEFRKNLKLEY